MLLAPWGPTKGTCAPPGWAWGPQEQACHQEGKVQHNQEAQHTATDPPPASTDGASTAQGERAPQGPAQPCTPEHTGHTTEQEEFLSLHCLTLRQLRADLFNHRLDSTQSLPTHPPIHGCYHHYSPQNVEVRLRTRSFYFPSPVTSYKIHLRHHKFLPSLLDACVLRHLLTTAINYCNTQTQHLSIPQLHTAKPAEDVLSAI